MPGNEWSWTKFAWRMQFDAIYNLRSAFTHRRREICADLHKISYIVHGKFRLVKKTSAMRTFSHWFYLPFLFKVWRNIRSPYLMCFALTYLLMVRVTAQRILQWICTSIKNEHYLRCNWCNMLAFRWITASDCTLVLISLDHHDWNVSYYLC